MKRIVIFASGSGTNAEKIIDHFSNSSVIKVTALFTNKADSGAAGIAVAHNIPIVCFDQRQLDGGEVLKKLIEIGPDLIVLAGFLKLLPVSIIQHFQNKIINIHPALLPAYGGKGFYGKHVHEAVLKAKEKYSGITIHLVDEKYDRGKILLQERCEVLKNDTSEKLAERIRLLEHKYYPSVIENILIEKEQK